MRLASVLAHCAALAVFSLVILASPARAQFAGGSGTLDDPFQIETVEQLQAVRNYLDRHFILINDIDASATASWNGGAGFQPLGPQPFTGSLDGGHRVISNLVINRPQASDVGFFVQIGSKGEVKRIGLVDADVRGYDRVGGLAGSSSGHLMESFTSGRVRGRLTVGGLIGANYGRVSRSFVAVDVEGSGHVGGLLSTNQGHVRDSYARGSVTQLGVGISGGGLVGLGYAGSISSSFAAVEAYGWSMRGLASLEYGHLEADGYWDVDLSGIPYSGSEFKRGVGRTTSEMFRQESFAGFDFSEDGPWAISEGQSYPYLKWQGGPQGHNLSGPRALTAEVGHEHVRLHWHSPLEAEPMGYRVFRNGELLTTSGLLVDTTYADFQVANHTGYQYRIAAVYTVDDQQLESYSSTIEAVPYGFTAGTGTPEDPWLIETPEHLSAIRFNPEGHYRLVNDLDLGVAPWNEGEGWEPIPSFTGTFDGDGHIIHGLTIDRTGESVGLFASIGTGGSVRKLGLVNVNVRGLVAGAFAAGIAGSLEAVFATGVVRGVYAGGLIGRNFLSFGTIADSYSMCFVEGESRVGGLVGEGAGTSNSYVVGMVVGREFVGMPSGSSYWNVDVADTIAAAGWKTTSELISASTFAGWDFSPEGPWTIEEGMYYPYHRWQGAVAAHNLPAPIAVTLEPAPASIELRWQRPPGTSDLLGYNVFRNGQLLNTDSLFTITEFRDTDLQPDQDYLYYLTSVYSVEGVPLESTPSKRLQGRLEVPFDGGDGSTEDPWQIASPEQLHRIRENLSGHYVLTADINLGVSPWNSEKGWKPVGFYYSEFSHACFSGDLEGAGFTISGLTIDRSEPATGLFACLREGAIRNVRLENVDISGGAYTGSLVGFLHHLSLVAGSSASGVVVGTDETGGLVGRSEFIGTRIETSHASVDVSGRNSVGGLLGGGWFVELEGLSASGRVSGYEAVGGLVGRAHATRIFTSSASGSVEGRDAAKGDAGGLVGHASSTRIQDSHASGPVSGRTRVGGLTGYQVLGNVVRSFATGDVEADGDEVGGLIGRNDGRLIDVYSSGSVRGRDVVGGLLGFQGGWEVLLRGYSTGAVTGESKVGGLIGDNPKGARSSYWDRESSGLDAGVGAGRTEGIVGLTTAEMNTSESYEGWPFGTIWSIDEGTSYPSLLSYSPEPLPPPQLLSPEDGSEVSGTVAFEWTGDLRAHSFLIHIAEDSAFVQTKKYVEGASLKSYEYEPHFPGTYFWRVRIQDEIGAGTWSETRSFIYSSATSAESIGLPGEFGVGQSYPNPMRKAATIPFQLPDAASVRLEVFDVVGRRVAMLVDSHLPAGYHTADVDARNLASGLYLYRLSVNGSVFTGTMVVID